MPRPRKCRRVGYLPAAQYFKPAGIPLSVIEEISLSIEEAEALRLKDLEGLDQEASSRKMNISRPTFQRILASARRKVSDALLNGKALRIGGGNVEMAFSRYCCRRGHRWDIPHEENDPTTSDLCPTCNAPGTRTEVLSQ